MMITLQSILFMINTGGDVRNGIKIPHSLILDGFKIHTLSCVMWFHGYDDNELFSNNISPNSYGRLLPCIVED